MKFTTTKNVKYRIGIGYIPKPWIEYESFDGVDDLEDVYRSSIMKYFYDEIKLWDFDICGDEVHDFVFEDGKAFRLHYGWWRDEYADEDESYLRDEYDIEEIDLKEANVPKSERDWL